MINDPVVLAAISAAVSAQQAKSAKAALPAGSTVPVDVTVRVTGTLTKDATGKTVADSTALEWSSMLAVALHRAGFQRDAILTLIRDFLTGNLTDAERAAVARGDAMWEEAVKPLLPKRTNAPAVKADVTVTVVE